MEKNIKYLIIGDTIIDKNIFLSGIGLSLETPTIKTKFLSESYSYGGAANVAKYLKNLTNNVTFMTAVSSETEKHLEKFYNIKIINIKHFKENIKSRFYIKHGNSSYNHLQINDVNDEEIKFNYDLDFSGFDVIAFSDYRCGLITEGLVKKVISFNKKTFAASQISSKESNFEIYKNINYIVCNENEAKFTNRQKNIYITYGKNGSSFNDKFHLGFPVEEKKIIGAGDCYYAGIIFYENIEMANKYASEYVKGTI
jgi:bifunctional ADP-heptose synthase (sugar kinase/adenylyltransferase)